MLGLPLSDPSHDSTWDRRTFKKKVKPLRCVRCYQLIHYGFAKGNPLTLDTEHFRRLLHGRLSTVEDRTCVVIKVIDVLDVAGSLLPDFSSLVGSQHRVILVANKVSISPITRIKRIMLQQYLSVLNFSWITQMITGYCEMTYPSRLICCGREPLRPISKWGLLWSQS